MPRRDEEIRLGDLVVVHRRGESMRGTLLGLVDSPVGREARVRLDGESKTVRVPVISLSPAPRPPSRWWWPGSVPLRVAVVGVLATLVAAVPSYFTWLSAGSSNHGRSSAATSKNTGGAASGRSPSPATRSATQPFEPVPNIGASCAELHNASLYGLHDHGRAVLVSSPGQLESGQGGLEGRIEPDGRYMKLLKVAPGEKLELSLRLFDGEYSAVQNVFVAARVTSFGPGCWRVVGNSRSTTNPGGTATLGPLLVLTPPGQALKLSYVTGSAVLLDEHDKHLATLPDGIMGGGVAVPYEIPPANLDIYYVNFGLRVA